MTEFQLYDNKITSDTFLEGVWRENPVFVALLGMCPVLAVTNTTINALAMGLATTFVLVSSSLLVSLLRQYIPKQVRIATYIVIIATFVTIVDYVIQAISLDLYNSLGAFIMLIVVNCMILGRAEAYASKHGSILGLSLFGESFQPWIVMILPPGGFFVLGGWLLLFDWMKAKKEKELLDQEGVRGN
jgi:electron transport complex protein RnfE